MKVNDAGMSRRGFLKGVGIGAVAAALVGCGVGRGSGEGMDAVLLTYGSGDRVARAEVVQRALRRLKSALEEKGQRVRLEADAKRYPSLAVCVAGAETEVGRRSLAEGKVTLAGGPEVFAVVPSPGGETAHVVVGSDAVGAAYAVTEIAERVEAGTVEMLSRMPQEVGRPANKVRGIMRMFVSEEEDKGWFYDREFWGRYLDMLAENRFNRFNLALGLGYDFSRNLTDVYFFFA